MTSASMRYVSVELARARVLAKNQPALACAILKDLFVHCLKDPDTIPLEIALRQGTNILKVDGLQDSPYACQHVAQTLAACESNEAINITRERSHELKIAVVRTLSAVLPAMTRIDGTRTDELLRVIGVHTNLDVTSFGFVAGVVSDGSALVISGPRDDRDIFRFAVRPSSRQSIIFVERGLIDTREKFLSHSRKNSPCDLDHFRRLMFFVTASEELLRAPRLPRLSNILAKKIRATLGVRPCHSAAARP